MDITVTVTEQELLKNFSREEALEFILKLDLKFAEEDFTLELIKRLIKSLESDLTREGVAAELGFAEKVEESRCDKFYGYTQITGRPTLYPVGDVGEKYAIGLKNGHWFWVYRDRITKVERSTRRTLSDNLKNGEMTAFDEDPFKS